MPSDDESNPRKGYVRPKKYVRPKEYRPRILPDAKEKLETLTKRFKLSEKVLLSLLIDRCGEIDLISPGFIERVEAVRKAGEKQLDRNRFEGLDNPCQRMKYANNCWNCVEGTDGKLVKIKTLSKLLDDALELCQGCSITISDKKKAQQLDNLIANGFVLDLPSCIHGGQTQGEGKKLKIYCLNSNMPAQYRSVHKWCKTMKNGANCPSLRWTRHVVKGKLPKLEK